jgi:hypothetical protein
MQPVWYHISSLDNLFYRFVTKVHSIRNFITHVPGTRGNLWEFSENNNFVTESEEKCVCEIYINQQS